GNRHAESYHPMGFLPCGNGWVCVGVASQEQWESFCIAIDMPELITDPRFLTGAHRIDNADEFDAVVRPWFEVRNVDDVVEWLQARDVPASPVTTVEEVLVEPQLEVRDFWRKLGGELGRVPVAPARVRG